MRRQYMNTTIQEAELGLTEGRVKENKVKGTIQLITR